MTAITSPSVEPVTLAVGEALRVSGLLQAPTRARACYVLAHGAGAGMAHPFLEAVATELGSRGIATLRYQFPFMERGSRRPDPPGLAQATVRVAAAEASRLLPGLVIVAGGRSFGGRMTSEAQAAEPLAGVRGLAFLGFPLHPAGRPSGQRGEHLSCVQVPMLFVQGTRDELAHLGLLQTLCDQLGEHASLVLLEDADHAFHVPPRSGRTDAEVRRQIVDALEAWIGTLVAE